MERRGLRVSRDLPVRSVTGLYDDQGRMLGREDRPLTAQQAAVVDRRAGRLLVSANAGAGKTSVMVERFVRDVLDGRAAAERGETDVIGCHSILAITFTRKSAGELRQRIRARFHELGEAELARDVEGAWISTIDGFCARVLRAHAVAASLDPAFVVLDDAQTRSLTAAAFDDALGSLLDAAGDADGPTIELVAGFGYDQLRETITAAYERLRSAGVSRPAMPLPAVPDVDAARSQLDRCQRLAADRIAGEAPALRADAAKDDLAACRAALDGAAVALPEEITGWSVSRGNAVLKEPVFDDYRTAVAAYAQAVGDAAARPLVATVAELLAAYGEAFGAAKAAVDGLDFTDLALHARDLLGEQPAIAAGYRRRLRRVMVDEFQDTNGLQLQLLDALGVADRFMVGDALQSIYGFRNADVAVFRRLQHETQAAGEFAELPTNFRSDRRILGLINAAFGAAHGSDWHPLAAPEGAQPADDEPRVELLITDLSAWADAPADMGSRVLAGMPANTRPGDAAEALAIAERVRAVIASGEATASQVAVLVRAGTKMPLFERAFERVGVPVLAAQGRGWWGRQEVQDLLHHLRIVLNGRDEQAVFGALASPLVSPTGGVTPDGLALLALDRAAHGDGVWDAVERAVAAAGGPALDPADRDRIERYAALLARERRAAGWAGPAELLQRVVADSGYEPSLLRGPGGARALANVRKLVRLARGFEQRAGGGLRAFVDYAAAQLEANAATPDAPVDTGEADAVSLMTIHGAKGLEFPVVVVADLGRKPPGRTPRILIEAGAVGVRLISTDRAKHSAFAYDDLKGLHERREQREERRVMHVAVTRAERRLILSAAVKLDESWPNDGTYAAPISWIGGGILGADTARLADDIVDELIAVPGAGGPDAAVRVAVNAPRTLGAVLQLDENAGGSQAGDVAAPAAPQPMLDPEPVPTAQPPAPPPTLSYSSLSSYADCGFRWYLERTLGLPRREGGAFARLGGAALSRGRIAHVLLEHADFGPRGGVPTPGEIRAVALADGAQLDDAALADQQRLVAGVFDGPLRERLAQARREVAFSLALRPGDPQVPLLTGFIDALVLEPGEPALVVDYKTDRVAHDADLASVVAANYGIQRAVYALAALRDGAPSVDVVHLYLERPAEPVSATYTQADAAGLEAELLASAAGILHGDFRVSPRPWAGLCGTCPGRGGLCSHSDAETDRESPEPEAASLTLF